MSSATSSTDTAKTTTTQGTSTWNPPRVKLFYAQICPWSQRVRTTAAEKNIPLELVEVPMSQSGELAEWFTDINPRRQVPTVQIWFPEDPDTCQTVTESMIICRLLESIGEPGSHSLLPGTAKIKYEVNWFCDEADRTINDLYHYCMSDEADLRKAAMASLDRMETLLSKTDGPYLLGNHFSLADISFGPFLNRMVYILMNFSQDNILIGRPHLAAFQKGCLIRPSFLKCLPDIRLLTATYCKFIPRPLKPPRMKLYGNPVCPFTQRVRITLKLLDIEYDTVHVDMPVCPQWYRSINPYGMLPTLELATGERLFDSLNVVQYLTQTFTSPVPLLYNLGKESPMEKARVEYLLDELEKKIKAFIAFKGKHRMHPAQLDMATISDETRQELEVLSKNVEDIEALLLKQHSGSGPFFLGDAISYADVACVPFFAHFLGLTHQVGKLQPDTLVRMQTIHAAVRSLDGVDEILSTMVAEAKKVTIDQKQAAKLEAMMVPRSCTAEAPASLRQDEAAAENAA